MTFIVDGTSGLTFPNSTTQASAGNVLQIVNATNMTSITTTSSSWTTTSFSASITPKFSTSKILILLNGGGGLVTGANVGLWVTVYRGATNIGDSTYGLMNMKSTATNILAPLAASVLDSPATTSSTTYTWYFRNSDNSTRVDFSNTDRGNLCFTLMEIAQ